MVLAPKIWSLSWVLLFFLFPYVVDA